MPRWERRPKPEVKEAQSGRRERAYGHFERMFLPSVLIDRDHVTAALHHGVLTVRLPKREMAQLKYMPSEEGVG
jgi:HSP20 family molecular chaperone IbpA